MSAGTQHNLAYRVGALLLRGVARALLLAVLAGVIGAIVVLIVLPRATQGSALTVLTGSMTPEIPVGSVVFVRPVDPATLEVGDVATYQKEEGVEAFVTHRIVAIDTSRTPISFTFKGDANRGEDIDPVPATAVRGEVWFHVPYLGAIRDALNGKAGLSLLAMLVLGGYALTQVWGAVQDRRRRHDTSSAVPTNPRNLRCDRPLILVELAANEGDPNAVAHGLNGVLLAETATTFTVLIAPPTDAVDTLVHELRVLEPTAIHVLDSEDSTLVLAPGALRPQHANIRRRGSHARA